MYKASSYLKCGSALAIVPTKLSTCTCTLFKQARSAAKKDGVLAGVSLLQQRLRLGWGTLRVAAGMAVGAKLYRVLERAVETRYAAAVVSTVSNLQRHTTGAAAGGSGGGSAAGAADRDR
jgi:hypothetical protein